MRNHIYSVLSILLCAVTFVSCDQPREYSVMQWNIWQEGTKVPGGYDAIVDELCRLQPDFVTLSEVRNYKDDFTARLVNDLAGKGLTYYTGPSYDSGLLSRYPVERFDTIFPENGDHGSIYRLLTTTTDGHRFAIYTAHLDYQDCAYYEPRGYSGVNWKECEIPTDPDSLLVKNDLSQRDEAIAIFLDSAAMDIADGRIVVLGGDFNEPSHLDWTEATASMRDHAGLIVPWTVSTMLTEAGYTDAYRAIYPDPVTHPCFTFPSANDAIDPAKLTWAPDGDERERIDFIYFRSPSGNAVVTDAVMFGPRGSVDHSVVVPDPGEDPLIEPAGVWPTDHKGVIVKLKCEKI